MTTTRVATARTTDPDTSKAAATKANATRRLVAHSVLNLVADNGILTGSAINNIYSVGYTPVCAWDSPRKRAGELATDGFLSILGTSNGEHEYVVSYTGWEYLKALGLK